MECHISTATRQFGDHDGNQNVGTGKKKQKPCDYADRDLAICETRVGGMGLEQGPTDAENIGWAESLLDNC